MDLMKLLNQTPNCFVFLPIRWKDLFNRQLQIRRTLRCLAAALQHASPLIGEWHTHIHINCIPQADSCFAHAMLEEFCSQHPLCPSYSHASDIGKIHSINRGLHIARDHKAHIFICVDNDIKFSVHAIRRLIEAFLKHRGSGITCAKMPALSANSSKFQRNHSYFFEVMFELGIGPVRPTGSLYAIDPTAIPQFPANCNEGDYLDSLKLQQSGLVIRSELSSDMETEISRRVRLWESSCAIRYVRFNDDEEFMTRLLDGASRKHAILRSKRFLDSKDTYFAILRGMKSIVLSSSTTNRRPKP